MRVMFTSTSGQGHFQRLVPFIRTCRERGDDVLAVVPAKLVATVEPLKIEFRLGDDPDSAAADNLWSQFASLPRAEASALVERDWFAGLCLTATLPSVENAVREWRPDLVLRESCEYAGAVAADLYGARHATVGISTARAELSVLREYSGPVLNDISAGLASWVENAPYLTHFPASLDPSPFPLTLRYREHDLHEPRPLESWWEDMTPPLIYVTLGTVVTSMPYGKEILRMILDALGEFDARILVTTGPSLTPDQLGEFASNVHVERWVSHDDAVAASSLVVCHGGSGTVFGSLAAGVPLVIAPFFADQTTNASLVEATGAGIALISGTYSAQENMQAVMGSKESLRSAVTTILATPTFRESSRLIARELRDADTPSTVFDRLIALW
jgi:UDP:flavonoid glycosyltransferase YjiC (YdhE family)